MAQPSGKDSYLHSMLRLLVNPFALPWRAWAWPPHRRRPPLDASTEVSRWNDASEHEDSRPPTHLSTKQWLWLIIASFLWQSSNGMWQ